MRYFLMVIIFIFALIAPRTVFYYLSPWGIRPDLIMLWTIYISLYSQPRSAVAAAFVMGLLTDLYIGSIIGQYTIALCAVALVSIRLQEGWDKEKIALAAALVFAVTLAGQAVMAFLAALSGFGWTFAENVKIIGGVAVYNALLVLPTFFLIKGSFSKGWLHKSTGYDLKN